MQFLAYVPAVYFRKWVAIDNKRLYLVQVLACFVTVGFVIYLLLTMPDYKTQVKPNMRLNMWQVAPASATSNNSFCESAETYTYRPSMSSPWGFGPSSASDRRPTCIRRCEVPSNATGPCIQSLDLMQRGSNELFFATSYTDEDLVVAGGCELTGQCVRSRSSYLVQDVDAFSANFDVKYQVMLPDSILHSIFNWPLLPTLDLLTVVLDKDLKEVKRFPTAQGVTLTLRELLSAAHLSLDDPVQGASTAFPATGDARPKPRAVGLDIALQMDISNELQFNSDGPVCRIRVTGKPSWVARKVIHNLDASGSVRVRRYSGVRVAVHHQAQFAWFQIYRMIYSLTLAVAWMQIPFFVVFYFAVYCLGALSDVYQGFLYEDVDLSNEFNGVSARMLEMSFGFSDVHDLEEEQQSVWGISQKRASKRMEMILEGAEELDKAERDLFSDFFFSRTAGRMPSGQRALLVEGFLETATSNENLLIGDIIKIIDSDAQNQHLLERFFMDDSLRAFTKKDDSIAVQLNMVITQQKSRKSSERDVAIESPELLLSQLRRHRDLAALRGCNLVRCAYGQTIVSEQVEALLEALCELRRKIEAAKQAT